MTYNLRDLLKLSRIPGVGSHRLRALVAHFQNPSSVLEASPRELVAVEGMDRKTALAIAGFARSTDLPETERYIADQLARLARTRARVVTLWDKEYPTLLKKIYDPPPFLFVRGSFEASDAHAIAIVGTREPSPYGMQMAERLAAGLAGLGIPIVSGLARGIDTCAHTAVVKAGGRTLAIIGSGVDVVYPAENAPLAERIIRTGALVSEYGMGAKPDAVNFPRRNRIISGLALGTVVVETGIEGGAMITATIALDQNREVFAVPGNVSDKRASGTHLLIKEGKAVLTECIEDVIAELAPRLKGILPAAGALPTPPPPELTLFETRIFETIGENPVHIDMLAQRSGFSTGDALVHLLSLEFKGLVRQLPGKMFLRT